MTNDITTALAVLTAALVSAVRDERADVVGRSKSGCCIVSRSKSGCCVVARSKSGCC